LRGKKEGPGEEELGPQNGVHTLIQAYCLGEELELKAGPIKPDPALFFGRFLVDSRSYTLKQAAKTMTACAENK
jgi:hypothetical protein